MEPLTSMWSFHSTTPTPDLGSGLPLTLKATEVGLFRLKYYIKISLASCLSYDDLFNNN